jgi:hypothetical protein
VIEPTVTKPLNVNGDIVNKLIKNDQWIYVLVHGAEGDEQLLGQQDEQTGRSFIPVFLKKEDALMNMNLLAREKGRKYEVQAMLYEDLLERIAGQGFALFVLNESGEIMEKINT